MASKQQKDDQEEDIYVNGEWDDYPGARQRTRPGKAAGEEIYDQVRDTSGRLVTDKPANQAMLSAQRARLERQRRVEADALARQQRRAARQANGGSSFSWSTLLVLSLFVPLLGHFLTGSYDFHLTPQVVKYLRHLPVNPWRVRLQTFSMDELAKHDGRAEEDVWVAIGGEVFDVTANRRIYGHGGSYNMMAGRDASRAYTTGCFQTHLTHDIRGLDEDQLKALENWKTFFAKHEKYVHIGHVALPPIDPSSPIPEPCNTDPAPGEGSSDQGPPAGAHGPQPKPANPNRRRKIHAHGARS